MIEHINLQFELHQVTLKICQKKIVHEQKKKDDTELITFKNYRQKA